MTFSLKIGYIGSLKWKKIYKRLFQATYRGADKSLARPDWKKQLKGRHFSSDAQVIAAAETWFDGRPSDFFFSDLQKPESL